MNRRNFLQIGAFGAGLVLTDILRLKAAIIAILVTLLLPSIQTTREAHQNLNMKLA